MLNRNMIELFISIIIIVLAILLIYSRQPPKPETPKIYKEEEIKNAQELMTVDVANEDPLFIGIIGESFGDAEMGEAFNTVVLQHLLQVLKHRNVQAVFATGNLVTAQDHTKKPDSWILRQQLQDFSQLYSSAMGKVPFFPAMGANEASASTTSQNFRENFSLGNGFAFDTNTFGYAVSIGKAFFAVVPTYIVDIQKGKIEPSFSPKMLEWLDSTLKKASQSHSYLFVVGHEPAFLPTVTFPNKQTPQRDAFWQTLVDNEVTAYFCSHEQLFDRTNRHGVWQIISGGGGSAYQENRKDKPFYHCLLLTIAAGGKKSAVVEALDENGNARDKFDLTPNQSILHQLHISFSLSQW